MTPKDMEQEDGSTISCMDQTESAKFAGQSSAAVFLALAHFNRNTDNLFGAVYILKLASVEKKISSGSCYCIRSLHATMLE